MTYAVRQAKLWSCYVQAAGVLNGLYAPHNSSANKVLVEDMAAACTHRLKNDSPTVLTLYPRVLLDKGLQNSTDRALKGKVRRQHFVETLDVALKGQLQSKVSTGQFFGVQRAYVKGADRLVHSKAVVLVELAIENNWTNTFEDLVAPIQKLKPLGERRTQHVTIKEASKDAKETTEYLKAHTKHILHSVTALTLCPDQINGTRIINLGTRAHYTKFEEPYKNFGSPDSCQDFAISMARFGWLNMLKDAWKSLSDTEELERCGFTLKFSAATLKKTEALRNKLAYENALTHTLESHPHSIPLPKNVYIYIYIYT